MAPLGIWFLNCILLVKGVKALLYQDGAITVFRQAGEKANALVAFPAGAPIDILPVKLTVVLEIYNVRGTECYSLLGLR